MQNPYGEDIGLQSYDGMAIHLCDTAIFTDDVVINCAVLFAGLQHVRFCHLVFMHYTYGFTPDISAILVGP